MPERLRRHVTLADGRAPADWRRAAATSRGAAAARRSAAAARRSAAAAWRGAAATWRKAAAAACAAVLLASCGPSLSQDLTVEVVRQLPHDTGAFTQGLLLHDGLLYESTGLVGSSSLRTVLPETGEVVRQRDIPPPYFAEGLALVGDELLQLTYRAGKLFRWDRETFEPLGEQSYSGEGWGLCFDGEDLWMTDGTAELERRDPETFEVLSSVTVKRDRANVTQLNELECVNGAVYANVWHSDEIMRIDPQTGRVTATIDASPLRALMPGGMESGAVLNGIAYDEERDLFLLTGKLWPSLFEVRFVPTDD